MDQILYLFKNQRLNEYFPENDKKMAKDLSAFLCEKLAQIKLKTLYLSHYRVIV
jgi:hypothetical protein